MPSLRDFLMPDLGEGLTEGEITRWLVAVGDTVTVDQPIAEISTEKAIVEVPTPFAGRVATLHGAEGDLIAVGTPLISIEIAGGTSEAPSGNVLVGYGTSEAPPRTHRAAAPSRQSAQGAPRPAVGTRPPASPLVRRRAAALGIDLSAIIGTGPDGMVTQADLEAAAGQDGAAPAAAGDEPAVVAGGTRTPLRGVARIAAERLTRSHHDAPTATAWLSADAERLVELRTQLDAATDVHVTPFAVILRLVVIALGDFPRLNAHFDTKSNEIVSFDAIHLGVAAQTDRGLVVPVIRDAQDKELTDIAADLHRLATAARDGSIDAADLRGSTFTVSNFGAFGVDGGAALINPPEAGILGVGQITTRPWVVSNQVVPRKIVELSLVFDHRVADGGLAGGFLRRVADLIEAPEEVMTDD
jgi:2-oxoisovalerate dehydrogenase E2 component (dihydrolipoyl transacylase)